MEQRQDLLPWGQKGSSWESMRRMWAESLGTEARRGLTGDGLSVPPSPELGGAHTKVTANTVLPTHPGPLSLPTLSWGLPARCTYLGRRGGGVGCWGQHPPALPPRAGPGHFLIDWFKDKDKERILKVVREVACHIQGILSVIIS